MKKLKMIIRQSIIGGVLVLLPITIIVIVFRWAYYFITDLIEPLTEYVKVDHGLPAYAADISVIVFIFILCFVVGTIVSTSVGRYLHGHFDKYLVRLAPGYRLIKEIVGQVFGTENSPFAKGEVVRVKLFGETCETTVTALVTSRHSDGTITIFMPTGPNPTSGNIYHVPEKLVTFHPEISVEAMMKSIIACGAGSDKLFSQSPNSPNFQ